jgi:ABC-type multidrug transport system ATPase subunit
LLYRGSLIACNDPRKLRDDLDAIVLEAHSDQAFAGRKAIETLEGVLSASAHGNLIRLLVDRQERLPQLQAAWRASNITIDQLHVVSARLEDVFVLMLSNNDK